MDNPETVTFDVGGKLFKVSRTLIDQFSETMLGKIVSETWQHDSSATVFIDRDGDIFAHVLNYLRYGSIVLPITISRAMFDREMDYYGIITDVDAHTIKQQSSIDALQLVKNKLEDAELEHDMFIIAIHAYHKFMTGHRCCFFNEESKIGLCRNPCQHSLNPRLDAKKILKEHLKAYYGIDAWSISFSQQSKGAFGSTFSSGVNLNMRNGKESIFDNPTTCGNPKDGDWQCTSCSATNLADADTCLACDEAKPVQSYETINNSFASSRLPSHSFGTWSNRNDTQLFDM